MMMTSRRKNKPSIDYSFLYCINIKLQHTELASSGKCFLHRWRYDLQKIHSGQDCQHFNCNLLKCTRLLLITQVPLEEFNIPQLEVMYKKLRNPTKKLVTKMVLISLHLWSHCSRSNLSFLQRSM